MAVLDEAVILNNGSLMPKVGLELGSEDKLKEAMKAGYRLFSINDGQFNIKKTSKESNVRFEQIFIQVTISKDMKADEVADYIRNLIKEMDEPYCDLVLLEASDDAERNLNAWRELEKLHVQGRINSLGLIDFYLDDLKALFTKAKYKPVLDQVNIADSELLNYLNSKKIRIEIMLVNDKNAVINDIAEQKKVSSEQVLLRYNLDENMITLLNANIDLQNISKITFNLSSEEKQRIGDSLRG